MYGEGKERWLEETASNKKGWPAKKFRATSALSGTNRKEFGKFTFPNFNTSCLHPEESISQHCNGILLFLSLRRLKSDGSPPSLGFSDGKMCSCYGPSTPTYLPEAYGLRLSTVLEYSHGM